MLQVYLYCYKYSSSNMTSTCVLNAVFSRSCLARSIVDFSIEVEACFFNTVFCIFVYVKKDTKQTSIHQIITPKYTKLLHMICAGVVFILMCVVGALYTVCL